MRTAATALRSEPSLKHRAEILAEAERLNQLRKVELIMERVRNGEEALYSLDDVERNLGLDGADPCR